MYEALQYDTQGENSAVAYIEIVNPDRQRPPRISVVIATYNYGQYLAEAVGSVAQQTFQDFELVIVDDGSTDGTREVVEGLKEKYPSHRIKYISQENQGLSGARNTAIGAASGEYIQPLDADDMLSPEFLEESLKAIEDDPGLTFVYTAPSYFGELAWRITGKSDRRYDLERLLKSNIICVSPLFRRSAWDEVGGFKLRGPGTGYYDWEFYLSLVEAGHTGRHVDGPLYISRRHEGSERYKAMPRHRNITYWRRGQHLRLYYPGYYTVHPGLARTANWLRSECRDRLSFYISRRHPALHAVIRKLLVGVGLVRPRK